LQSGETVFEFVVVYLAHWTVKNADFEVVFLQHRRHVRQAERRKKRVMRHPLKERRVYQSYLRFIRLAHLSYPLTGNFRVRLVILQPSGWVLDNIVGGF
jgi:hypothetical protein